VHVDPAVPAEHRPRHRIHRRRIGDVGFDHHRLAAHLGDGTGGRLGVGDVP
jgi:hypothetical protein